MKQTVIPGNKILHLIPTRLNNWIGICTLEDKRNVEELPLP